MPPFYNSETEVFSKLKETVKRNEKFDFYLIRFFRLDSIGHRLGPDSDPAKCERRRIDKVLEDLIQTFNEFLKHPIFLIFSDHGMCEVKNTVNIMDRLFRFVSLKKVIPFLDSTMARFWFLDSKTCVKVKRLLEDLDGHFLSQEDMINMNLDFKDSRYGELIWVLPEESMIFPDFYNISPCKGMHGYALPLRTNALDPFVMINGPKIPCYTPSMKVDFTQVLPTLLGLLKLPTPSTSNKKTLFDIL